MPEEPYGQETWKDSRDRRLRALSELASSKVGGASDTTSESPEQLASSPVPVASPLPRRRKLVAPLRWRIFGIAVLVVVIAGGVLTVVSHMQSTEDAHSQTAFHMRSISVRDLLGLHCITQPAWSPDGKYIALLGTAQTGDCVPYLSLSTDVSASSGPTPPQTLAIIDARNGSVVHSIALDPLLSTIK